MLSNVIGLVGGIGLAWIVGIIRARTAIDEITQSCFTLFMFWISARYLGVWKS